jgi:hypothetical protein
MAKWQFQDFCKENLGNNDEFRRVVETTRTGEIFQTWVIQTGNADQKHHRHDRQDEKVLKIQEVRRH